VALARAAADADGLEVADGHRREAARLARAAAEADPRLAAAPETEARAHMSLAMAARARGEPDAEQAAYREALSAQAKAIALAKEAPGHRAQGRALADLLVTRASMRLSAHEEEGALADYLDAAGLGPRDPDTIHRVAYGLLQSGRYPEAIHEYERLTDLVGSSDQWTFLAFAHERMGLERERTGDRAGALAALATAVDVYGRAVARAGEGESAVFPLSYRAEAHVARARLLSGEAREAALEAAGEDFAEVARRKGERVEADRDVLHRRAEWRHAKGDLEAAYADARRAGGSEGDGSPTPAMQARAARYAIDLARAVADRREAGRTGRVEALLDEAIGFADLGARGVPGYASPYLRLRGEARAARAALRPTRPARRAAMTEAYADFTAALDAGGDDAGARAEALRAHAEALLLAEEPAAAAAKAAEAARLRDAEAAAGRWSRDASWWRLAAEAADRAGEPDAAAEARAHAEEIDAASR
jgi:tetratricopeptide (TPR) repeat protein